MLLGRDVPRIPTLPVLEQYWRGAMNHIHKNLEHLAKIKGKTIADVRFGESVGLRDIVLVFTDESSVRFQVHWNQPAIPVPVSKLQLVRSNGTICQTTDEVLS
jgi:hypothetical protein